MIIEVGRLEVRLISPDSLRQYMRFRHLTIREVARRAGCSRSLVGFLVKGTRKTCGPDTARRIAEAVDCPVEALFVPRISNVQREVRSQAV